MAEAWEDPEYKSLVADINFAFGTELAGIKENLGEQQAEAAHGDVEQKLAEPGRFRSIDVASNRAGLLESGMEFRNVGHQQAVFGEQASNRQKTLERQETNAKAREERAGAGHAQKLGGASEMAKQRYANWVRENPPPAPTAPTPPPPPSGGVYTGPAGAGGVVPYTWGTGNVRIGNPNVPNLRQIQKGRK